jgi:NAD-dependent dihydropyrimidine dehydrogenase PreA subunit
MTEEEAANAPAATKFAAKPVLKTNYKFTMAISPADCMGCTLCVKACPVNNNEKMGTAIEMVLASTQGDQQAPWDYAVANVSEKKELINATIRPFALTEEEAAGAPEVTKFTAKPVVKTNYKFTMAISPLDCMGCTLCVKACPVNAGVDKKAAAAGVKADPADYAIVMKPQATQSEQHTSSPQWPGE